MRTLSRCVTAALAALPLAALTIILAFATPTVASASGELVKYDTRVQAGTIIVHTNERRLYLSLGGGRAMRYPVGVGRAGMQWSGRSFIDGKYVRPAWSPPPDLRRPGMKDVYQPGDPANPM